MAAAVTALHPGSVVGVTEKLDELVVLLAGHRWHVGRLETAEALEKYLELLVRRQVDIGVGRAVAPVQGSAETGQAGDDYEEGHQTLGGIDSVHKVAKPLGVVAGSKALPGGHWESDDARLSLLQVAGTEQEVFDAVLRTALRVADGNVAVVAAAVRPKALPEKQPGTGVALPENSVRTEDLSTLADR